MELHKDGSPHIHAFFKFSKEYSTRNCRTFDVKGRHPNIQEARSETAVRKYVAKGGVVLAPDTVVYKPQQLSVKTIVETSKAKEEFLLGSK